MSYSAVKIHDGEHGVRKQAGLGSRLAPLLVSLLGTGLGAIPVGLQWNQYRYDSNSTLYHLATNHRNSTQVVVSIISAILGFLWSYAACNAFNMFMRSWIAKRGIISLKWLRLDTAVSKNGPETKIPLWMAIISIFWFVLGQFPAQLWTGALTPSPDHRHFDKPNSVPVGQVNSEAQSLFTTYGQAPLGLNRVPAGGFCNGSLTLSNGTFHSCPGSVFSGKVVESIRSASTVNGAARNHSKLDKFNYVGRSYGAGSSVGVVDLPVGEIIESYNFTERGYISSSRCTYNASAAWRIADTPVYLDENITHGNPSLWRAQGWRPNDDPFQQAGPGSGPVSYPVMSYGTFPDRIMAFSAGSCCGNRTGQAPFMLSITTGANYTLFNNTQCELIFTPSTFNVTVAPTNRTVNVLPISNGTTPPPESQFLEWTALNLQSLTRTQTSLFISTIAEAFIDNVRTKTGTMPDYSSTVPPTKNQLEAIGEGVDAAIDDIMEALNAWALVLPGGWRNETAHVSTSVVALGTNGWNVALFVFNLVSFAIIAAVTLYTRLFAGSPEFDFADMASVLAAACRNIGHVGSTDTAGQGLGASDGNRHNASPTASRPTHLTGWRGDPNDPRLRDAVLEFDSRIGAASPPSVTIRGSGEPNQFGRRDAQS